jgi:hypothetical protein
MSCDHEVMGSKSWKQALAEMQGKTAYIRLKVVGPFSGAGASESYVHWAAPFFSLENDVAVFIVSLSSLCTVLK